MYAIGTSQLAADRTDGRVDAAMASAYPEHGANSEDTSPLGCDRFRLISRRSNSTGNHQRGGLALTNSTEKNPRRLRRLFIWAAALTVVALVLAAGTGGWWLADRTLVASADTHATAATAA